MFHQKTSEVLIVRVASLDALAEEFGVDNSKLRRMVAKGVQEWNGWTFKRLGHRLWMAVEGDASGLEIIEPKRVGKRSRLNNLTPKKEEGSTNLTPKKRENSLTNPTP